VSVFWLGVLPVCLFDVLGDLVDVCGVSMDWVGGGGFVFFVLGVFS